MRTLPTLCAWLLVLPLILGGNSASALDPNRTLTQYIHRIWQTQQGLPQGTVFAIRQTSDGYLWLGTQTGLIRFDGLRLQPIRAGAGEVLANAWINDLCEDREKHLWVATDGAGLVRLDRKEARQFTKADGLPSLNVQALACDAKGALWVGTDAGLVRQSGEKFVAPKECPFHDKGISAIAAASDGSLWVAGTGDLLARFHDDRWQMRTLAKRGIGFVQTLLADKDGTLWIGTSDGLIRLHENDERRFTTANGLSDDSIYCLATEKSGGLWIGTKDGFSRLCGEELQSFRKRDGLSQSAVYSLCEDHEGTLWVGTKHGLNQFLDRRTIPFTTSEGLPTNDVGPLWQDSKGVVWVGTSGSGLAKFDGRVFEPVLIEGLNGEPILSLTGGTDDATWIGTANGLFQVRGPLVSQVFTTREGLPSAAVRCVLCDSNNTVWAGTSTALAVLREGKFEQVDFENELLTAPILALAERENKLIVSTEGRGLYHYIDGKLAPWLRREIPRRDVYAMHVDADGSLWLATRGGGLVWIRGDRVHTFTSKDGLYDDDLCGIAADDRGRLWLACSTGIFCLTRSQLEQFADGKLTRVESINFSPTDALRTVECKLGVQPCALRTKDGRIWFSTTRGLIAVDPDHLERNLLPPAAVLEDVTVNGQLTDVDELASLPPGETNLAFRYSAISFRSPTRLAFRYQLVGFDKDWVDAGSRRQAFYTNLPPGHYEFRVAASNLEGEWSEQLVSLPLTLRPHFYQQRWFIPLVLACVAAAAWAAYRLRIARIKAQLHAVLAERSRIARELHDTLMQGFSGITMEMQALLARLQSTDEHETLAEIIRDAGNCLREARRSIAGLRQPTSGESGLVAAITQAARQLTETSNLRLQLALEAPAAPLPADVEYNLLRIAQEAITNAVKHSGARTLEVWLKSNAERIELSIQDDGVGLSPTSGDFAGHYGLVGMRERAAQIGGNLRIDSQPGKGTKITASLPLRHTATAATAVSPGVEAR